MVHSADSFVSDLEAQASLYLANAKREKEQAETQAYWTRYHEQLAKMPIYVPGTRGARSAMWYFKNEDLA